MRNVPSVWVGLIVLLMISSGASAQTLYFMRDAAEGPAVDGVLSWTPPPPPPDPAAPEQMTPPDARLVLPMVPVQFATRDAENNTGRIRGPVILGLWAPDLQTTQDATLRVELVHVPPSDLPLRPEGTVLATADVEVLAGNLTPPDPTPWLPPDPSDPEAAAAHIAAHAAAYALPLLVQPPYVVFFTDEDGLPLDLEIPVDADIGVRFTLLPGAQPIPVAIGQSIVYDFALAPSFLYVPWFEEPAPTTSSTTRTTAPSSSAPRPTIGDPGTGEPDGRDSPLGLVAVAGLVGAVLLARRRLA